MNISQDFPVIYNYTRHALNMTNWPEDLSLEFNALEFFGVYDAVEQALYHATSVSFVKVGVARFMFVEPNKIITTLAPVSQFRNRASNVGIDTLSNWYTRQTIYLPHSYPLILLECSKIKVQDQMLSN